MSKERTMDSFIFIFVLLDCIYCLLLSVVYAFSLEIVDEIGVRDLWIEDRVVSGSYRFIYLFP